MSREDAVGNTIKIIVFVGMILGSGITIYSVFHAPIVQALQQEKDERQKCDAELRKDLTNSVQEQQKTNETTNVLLTKIATQLTYIERAVKS